jgi:hypothetical protein
VQQGSLGRVAWASHFHLGANRLLVFSEKGRPTFCSSQRTLPANSDKKADQGCSFKPASKFGGSICCSSGHSATSITAFFSAVLVDSVPSYLALASCPSPVHGVGHSWVLGFFVSGCCRGGVVSELGWDESSGASNGNSPTRWLLSSRVRSKRPPPHLYHWAIKAKPWVAIWLGD